MMLRYLVILIAAFLLPPIVMSSPDIRIVFSDLDGTLIHYKDKHAERGEDSSPKEGEVVSLPASSTGMAGTISHKTYVYCRSIRSRGCKLIFVSGMRFSTLMTRLPYLPKADYYACDSGGRIFRANADSGMKRIVPKDPLDTPFYLQEDMEWRKRMEAIVGGDGYVELDTAEAALDSLVPMADRSGILWEYAARLRQKGVVLDAKSYATCFRINRKHNENVVFDALLKNGLEGLDDSLTTSVNLGCIDVVPKNSGKKNCCQYLAERLIMDTNKASSLLKNHCICLCDDDNDIEMALACHHAFLPSVASDSMRQTILAHPLQCTVANGADHALQLALEFIAPDDGESSDVRLREQHLQEAATVLR